MIYRILGSTGLKVSQLGFGAMRLPMRGEGDAAVLANPSPCPHGVEIAGIFEQFNLGRVYGVWEHVRKVYTWWTKEKKSADLCLECGACEDKCP